MPLTIVVDGKAYLEGQELDTEWFYERLAAGAEVSTAAPGPGQFLAQYEAAAKGGATQVLSMHLSGDLSGTANTARVAAEMSPIPVHVYDTQATGFGVDMCIDAAAGALGHGADIAGAIDAGTKVRGRTINVFVVGQAALLDRGGRSQVIGRSLASTSVWATGEALAEVGKIDDVDQMVGLMVGHIAQAVGDRAIRLAIGDAQAPAVARHLGDALLAEVKVAERVHYDVSPSLGAHLGPGTVAATVHTID